MNSIQYAKRAGICVERRNAYMREARERILREDRRFYVGLARNLNHTAIKWIRLARSNVP